MPFLELFDETLDINSTDNYDLSVQVGPDGLAFCILDSIRNKYILIRSSEPEEGKYFNASAVEEIIKKDDFLGRNFRKIRVMMPAVKSTLVPAPLYDPVKKDDYFTLNYIKEENETILSNKLEDPDSNVLYACQETFVDLIKNNFHDVQPVHHLKPLLRYISGERKKSAVYYVHVNIERDFFNLVIFDHNSLLLCNTYMYRKSSDILYYVLNAIRKLDIKTEEVHFSGLTSKYDELSAEFLVYIKNISFAVPSGDFTFSYVFNDLELHRYLNLLNLVNCE
jgi:hypothetical protein